MNTLIFILFLTHIDASWSDDERLVNPTKGEVWPKPQLTIKYEGFYGIRPSKFRFNTIGEDCDILQKAFKRYKNIISKNSEALKYLKPGSSNKTKSLQSPSFLGYLDKLDVYFVEPCGGDTFPSLDMNEKYTLSKNLLVATTIWGALRGLETFSQLLHFRDDPKTLFLRYSKIVDFPRFPHRGLLIDTSRHYIPLNIIFKMLDAMAYNKMNVFHWHLTDDQSFPFQSTEFPELSEKGAFHPMYAVYNVKDVADIVEYARLRGIRVLPEFDVPGHTRSWGLGVPKLLTQCNGDLSDYLGPMDPSKRFVYGFLRKFFAEIKTRFPDTYLHLGGDEVGFACWSTNQHVLTFMANLGIGGDFAALKSHFFKKVLKITRELEFKSIIWEDAFFNRMKFPYESDSIDKAGDSTDETANSTEETSNSTNAPTNYPKTSLHCNTTKPIVQVWKNGWKPIMSILTKNGYNTLLSSCWYLDFLKDSWTTFYQCEPLNFRGTPNQKRLVLGGEACMWGENVNEFNILPTTWPRASAVAEKLWSAADADIEFGAARRLEEHTCRMNFRGIPAQPPNGPGDCLHPFYHNKSACFQKNSWLMTIWASVMLLRIIFSVIYKNSCKIS